MKARYFTTRLILLSIYLTYFPLGCPGQLLTSVPNDDIKENLYHPLPKMWRKKMVEHGCNYLDGLLQAMAEFFETGIENLKNQSHQVFPQETRNRIKIPQIGKCHM